MKKVNNLFNAGYGWGRTYPLKTRLIKKTDPWDSLPNGVYAVGADGSPVMAEDADESCIGVALISDNQKIMIAKENAMYGTTPVLHWGYNLYQKDIRGIVDTENSNIAKTDFNGKTNTAAIIDAYTEYGVEMNNQDMCKILQKFNEDEKADWYVPACGQLYEIYQNKIVIDEILLNIGGIAYSTGGFWSSSEINNNDGWFVRLGDGGVLNIAKNNFCFVRFVRDLI